MISSEQEMKIKKAKQTFSGSEGNFEGTISKRGVMAARTTEISLLFTKIFKTK